jgi:hypothetical protein
LSVITYSNGHASVTRIIPTSICVSVSAMYRDKVNGVMYAVCLPAAVNPAAGATVISFNTTLVPSLLNPSQITVLPTKFDGSAYPNSMYYDSNTRVLFLTLFGGGLSCIAVTQQKYITFITPAYGLMSSLTGNLTTGMLYVAAPSLGVLSILQPPSIRLVSVISPSGVTVVPSYIYDGQSVTVTIYCASYVSFGSITITTIIVSSNISNGILVASKSTLTHIPYCNKYNNTNIGHTGYYK